MLQILITLMVTSSCLRFLRSVFILTMLIAPGNSVMMFGRVLEHIMRDMRMAAVPVWERRN